VLVDVDDFVEGGVGGAGLGRRRWQVPGQAEQVDGIGVQAGGDGDDKVGVGLGLAVDDVGDLGG